MDEDQSESLAPDRENSDVVNILMAMFGEAIDREVIQTVAECYAGDLTNSIEALMEISNEMPKGMASVKDAADNAKENEKTNQEELNQNSKTMSYANAFKSSTGAIPKVKPTRKNNNSPQSTSEPSFMIDQLQKIVDNHVSGACTLILMRGVAGSGKSFLARKIIDVTIGPNANAYKDHIYSTDDYFYYNGMYCFDKSKLSFAHEWNQNRVKKCLQRGLSPIIVDNTNLEMWEAEPYFKDGVRQGYFIDIVEPRTWWSKNVQQLAKRNVHNVPYESIRRMLIKFQDKITVDMIFSAHSLTYPSGKTPPVLRKIPQYVPVLKMEENNSFLDDEPIAQPSASNENQMNTWQQPNETLNASNEILSGIDIFKNLIITTNSDHEIMTPQQLAGAACKVSTEFIHLKDESFTNSTASDKQTTNPIKLIDKEHQEVNSDNPLDFEKMEKAWELNEQWVKVDEKQNDVECSNINTVSTPKEKRYPKRLIEKEKENKIILPYITEYQDWRNLSNPLLEQNTPSNKCSHEEAVIKDKISIGTVIHEHDFDIKNPLNICKVVTSTPKDINIDYLPIGKEEEIPYSSDLNKSTCTHDLSPCKCIYEKKHFAAFKKMFKNVPTNDLREIFDQCCGDVNWAVEIVLEGLDNNQLDVSVNDTSDENDENDVEDDCAHHCNCSSPSIVSNIQDSNPTEGELSRNVTIEQSPGPQKKHKKENIVPGTLIELKKHLEDNVVISDQHYSEHCLKIRNFRYGTSHNLGEDVACGSSYEAALPAPPTEVEDLDTESDSDLEEKTIYLGTDFLKQLDEIYGRKNMEYPKEIVPLITVPMALLNQINALWMESLTHQLDAQKQLLSIMMKEDEELARELAEKDEEMAREGREPEVPDFKEIMDMDFALSLYDKDAANWKSKMPNDLAAKMTREKLYNLFPDVSKDLLSEMLMAHDNNFQATVEVLLMSTGQAHVLEQKNGINKFVMEKEIERHDKILHDEYEKIDDKPVVQTEVSMETVDAYRQEAKIHFEQRNYNYGRAQDFARRGMTQVAGHYFGAASFHKTWMEHSNSLASSALIHIQSQTNSSSTVDLHYMHVVEALHTLDIFMDQYITRAREIKRKIKGIYVITGRGVHSVGGPKIRPAVQRRLKKRDIKFKMLNPGVVNIQVSGQEPLTNELK